MLFFLIPVHEARSLLNAAFNKQTKESFGWYCIGPRSPVLLDVLSLGLEAQNIYSPTPASSPHDRSHKQLLQFTVIHMWHYFSR